jgi:hypothetical protein
MILNDPLQAGSHLFQQYCDFWDTTEKSMGLM